MTPAAASANSCEASSEKERRRRREERSARPASGLDPHSRPLDPILVDSTYSRGLDPILAGTRPYSRGLDSILVSYYGCVRSSRRHRTYHTYTFPSCLCDLLCSSTSAARGLTLRAPRLWLPSAACSCCNSRSPHASNNANVPGRMARSAAAPTPSAPHAVTTSAKRCAQYRSKPAAFAASYVAANAVPARLDASSASSRDSDARVALDFSPGGCSARLARRHPRRTSNSDAPRRGDERRRSSELAFSLRRSDARSAHDGANPPRTDLGDSSAGATTRGICAILATHLAPSGVLSPRSAIPTSDAIATEITARARGCGRRTPRGALRGGARHAAQRRDERFRVRLERRARALPAAPPRRHVEEHLRALRGRRRRRREGPTSVRIFRVRGDIVRVGDIVEILPSSEGSDATRAAASAARKRSMMARYVAPTSRFPAPLVSDARHRSSALSRRGAGAGTCGAADEGRPERRRRSS